MNKGKINTMKKYIRSDWTKDSWKKLNIKQQPAYPDMNKLQEVTNLVIYFFKN